MSARGWPTIARFEHTHQMDFALRMADGYRLAPPRCLRCNLTVSQILALPEPAAFVMACAKDAPCFTAFTWGNRRGVFAAGRLSC